VNGIWRNLYKYFMMKQTTKDKTSERDGNGTPINRAKTWGKKTKCPKNSRRKSKEELR